MIVPNYGETLQALARPPSAAAALLLPPHTSCALDNTTTAAEPLSRNRR